MVADPSSRRGDIAVSSDVAPSRPAQRGRQTTLARYTGLPRSLPAPLLACWRLKEPKDLIGNGPLSGLEEQRGEPLPTRSEDKGRGEESEIGVSIYTTTPSEG